MIGLLPNETTRHAALPLARLALRLAAGPRAGQIVRWNAENCSIGAAPGATVRLRASGIAPLHCVVRRGARGTTIQRLAHPAELNGATFDRAWLTPGDRLRIGPLEFDVVDEAPRQEPVEVPAIAPAAAISPSQEVATTAPAPELPDSPLAPLVEAIRDFAGDPAPPAVPCRTENDVDQIHSRLDLIDQAIGSLRERECEQSSYFEQFVRDQLEIRSRQLENLNGQVGSLEQIVGAWQAECDQLKTEVASLAASVSLRLSTIESDVVRLAEAPVQERFESLDKQLLTLANQSADQLERLQELEPRLQRHIVQAEGQLASRIELLYLALSQHEERLAQLQHQGEANSAWQIVCQELRSEIQAAAAAVQTRLGEIDAAVAETRSLAAQPQRTDAEGWKEPYARLEAGLASLQANIASRLEPIEKLMSELRHQSEEMLRERHDHQRQLIRLQAQWIERSDQLGEQLASLENRCESLERPGSAEIEPASRNERSEQIDHRLAELRAEREAFEQERRLHHADLSVSPTEHSRQMTQRLAEIQAEREALEWERREHDEIVAGAARYAAVENPEAAALVEQLEQLRSSLVSPSPAEAEAPASRPDVRDQGDRADAFDPAGLPPAPAVDIRDDYASSHTTFDNRQPERQLEEPIDDVEQLDEQRRKEDDAEADVSSNFGQPEPTYPDRMTSRGEAADEEDSIDAYMARLMERVRGMAGSKAPAAEAPRPAATTSMASEPTVRTQSVDLDGGAADDDDGEPEQPATLKQPSRPRTVPIEQTVNFSAMRDLANLSTRLALDTHAQRTLTHKTYSKLIVSIFGLGSGGTMAYFATQGDLLTLLGAAFSTVAGVVWGVQFFMLMCRRRRKRPVPHDAGTAAPQPASNNQAAALEQPGELQEALGDLTPGALEGQDGLSSNAVLEASRETVPE
jgi:hypothetical protein